MKNVKQGKMLSMPLDACSIRLTCQNFAMLVQHRFAGSNLGSIGYTNKEKMSPYFKNKGHQNFIGKRDIIFSSIGSNSFSR